MILNAPDPAGSLVVVTDLDGTLLDHASYSYDPARPALMALRRAGVPLVLATSKTAAEVGPLHAELGLGRAPAIVENGAGLLGAAEGHQAYDTIRTALDGLPPALRACFAGFGDLGPDRVAEITGLMPQAARAACQRQFSEPGLWQGDDAQQAAFLQALAEHGITGRRGGRFLTLSHGRTKADAMAEVARTLQARRVVALGDAPNDIEMLQAADIGVIIRNDHGAPIPPLPGEDTGAIRRTGKPGPDGWNTAVLGILRDHGITK